MTLDAKNISRKHLAHKMVSKQTNKQTPKLKAQTLQDIETRAQMGVGRGWWRTGHWKENAPCSRLHGAQCLKVLSRMPPWVGDSQALRLWARTHPPSWPPPASPGGPVCAEWRGAGSVGRAGARGALGPQTLPRHSESALNPAWTFPVNTARWQSCLPAGWICNCERGNGTSCF